jgi:hypothetical protein
MSDSRTFVRFGTQRRDAWWLEIIPVVLLLGGFGVYATFRAFEGSYYQWGPYLSPFYSPLIDASHHWWPYSPALLILALPLGFRATCYYYRKAYYRGFWFSPPACAVSEPHKKYTGERRFPLILQNSHRFWWYIAMLFNIMLTYDVVKAFDFNGSIGMSLGTLMLLVNLILIFLYTITCHSCRHIMGGRLNHFNRHPLRYKAWTLISKGNARHGTFAMTSLIFIALTDLYIRLAASTWIHDVRFF